MMAETASETAPNRGLRTITAVSQVIVTIAVPVLLTLASVRLVMTPVYLQLVYNLPGFPADTYGFTLEDRLQYAPLAIEYMLNGEGIDFLGDLRLPLDKCISGARGAKDCATYNVSELHHMRDVKAVTQYAFLLATVLGGLAAGAVCILLRFRPAHGERWRSLMNGSLLTLGIIATIIVAAVTSWDFFFTAFHSVFFQSGTWRFAFSDTLIRLFPEQFWFDTAITVGSLTTIGAVIILIISWRWARKNRPS